MNLIPIADSVDMLFVKKDNFKTTTVSFNFYLPLVKENISENALLAYLLSSCSERFKTFLELNLKLNELYGADLTATVEKIGDAQHIRLAVSVIDDKYALDGESIIKEAVDMLMNLIFNPKVKENSFEKEDVEREKRKLAEHISGEINDKRIYARGRLIEEMFENSPYGVSRYGTIEGLKAVDGKRLYNAWLRLLSDSYLRVQIVGSALPLGIEKIIAEKFNSLKRNVVFDCSNTTVLPCREQVKIISDKMDVAQGKLVMGFSSKLSGHGAYALQVATDIFGGGPYSYLFENVREKMSLCYYCSASPNKNKGFVMVDSGVELQNVDKAKTEIINQLEKVKNGDFTDFVLSASIKSITGALNSCNDSISALDVWYSKNIFGEILSPEEIAEKISLVTRDDVIEAAKGIKLHTIYELLPKGETNAN